MNNLQLTQKLKDEAEIAGSALTTVQNLTGELALLAQWIIEEHRTILNMHGGEWNFLRDDFTFNTVSGTRSYTPTVAGQTDFKRWILENQHGFWTSYLTVTGVTDEQEMVYLPWDHYRRSYNFGSTRNDTGRPQVYSIRPKDQAVFFWPTPNDIYTISGEKFRSGQDLSDDEDTPEFPVDYHLLIVFRALMRFSVPYAQQAKYQHGLNESRRILKALELNELPRPGWGQPLC